MNDCISKAEKAREYRAIDWHATKRSESRYIATNAGTGAKIEFVVAFGRVFFARSEQSGNEYPIYGGACCCRDKERALKAGRCCRHEAALPCVETLIDRLREAEERDLRTPNKWRNRQETLIGTITAASDMARHLIENEIGRAA